MFVGHGSVFVGWEGREPGTGPGSCGAPQSGGPSGVLLAEGLGFGGLALDDALHQKVLHLGRGAR